MEIAAFVGAKRHIESVFAGRTPADGFDQTKADIYRINIEGAAAEMAYCKFRGVYFPATVNNFKSADVGSNVQVRHTKRPDGDLRITKNDNPEHFFVLVIGIPPVMHIVGWIKGADGMRPEWLRVLTEGRAASYWVPQRELNGFKKGGST